MAKTIRSRVASYRKVKKVRQKNGGNTGARFCFRCEARMNNCIARGCLPYEFEMTTQSLDEVVASLGNLDKLEEPVRYYSDCIDTWFVQKYVTKLRARTNIKTALFAIMFYAHFLNTLTLHCVRKGLGRVVDFHKMKISLTACERLGYAFHRAKTLGGGALKVTGVAKGIPTIIAAFRKLYNNPHFDAIAKQLGSPIETVAAYRQFYADVDKLRASIPGLLGTYRFKNMLDVLVAAKWIKVKALCKWPVDPQSGTAVGLRRVYKTKTTSQKELEKMLSELVHRLRCKGYHHDHHGTIGMALCWEKRLNTAAGRQEASNGLEASQKVWKTQMQAVEEAGL